MVIDSINQALKYANIFIAKAKLRGGFDLDQFKLLDDPKPMKRFLVDPDSGLQQLGYGSSREVYLLSSKYVIKFAITDAGVAQNQTEYKLSNDARLIGLTAQVYDYHPKFYWIISELVRPITDQNEFQSLTGMNYEDFRQYVLYGVQPETGPIPIIAKRIINVISDKVLSAGDALKLDSWGKASDGRLVLFDYGLTSSVYKEFYDEGMVRNPGFAAEPETVKPIPRAQ